jgi:hypothetical protein
MAPDANKNGVAIHVQGGLSFSLFALSTFLTHLFIAITCFSFTNTTTDAGVAQAAYVVAVLAIISAAVRLFQLVLYVIGSGNWDNNLRLGNGFLSVLFSAILVALSAPGSVLFEARSKDSLPTAQLVLYTSMVSLVFCYVETVASHAYFVVVEPKRTGLIGDGMTNFRYLIISVTAGFVFFALGFTSYACAICARVRNQSALPYKKYTLAAEGAIFAAPMLLAYLATALACHAVVLVMSAFRGSSRSLDADVFPRTIRVAISTAGVMFSTMAFGAVLPKASLMGVARGIPDTAFTDGESDVTHLQDIVFSATALVVASLFMHHVIAASRIKQ